MSLARLWRDQGKARQALEWDKPDKAQAYFDCAVTVARSVRWREFDQEEQLRVKPKRPLKSDTQKRRTSLARCKDFAQSWLFPLSVSVSRRRPRASRDMTVPIGTSVV
jgi:hypothetical protein